jgi:hypothetical protein
MTLNSALTRFINQGLARATCPLCHVAHKLDREYMWHFFDEYSDDAATIEELRRSGGFCGKHADQLRAIEVEGLGSTLGISTVYLETLQGLARELADRRADQPLAARAGCPACRYRDEEILKNAAYLLELVADDDAARERLADGPGLCIVHFQIAWRLADPALRDPLAEMQLRSTERLVEELQLHIHRQTEAGRHEPAGDEADAWQRAVYFGAGWPANR